ncbi:hypothetical protein C8Q79DRAFT_154452 [Trametes meyenii]|nr:hypothetical protein C8Q79DRAFT_154452 [Trametes meyenii]
MQNLASSYATKCATASQRTLLHCASLWRLAIRAGGHSRHVLVRRPQRLLWGIDESSTSNASHLSLRPSNFVEPPQNYSKNSTSFTRALGAPSRLIGCRFVLRRHRLRTHCPVAVLRCPNKEGQMVRPASCFGVFDHESGPSSSFSLLDVFERRESRRTANEGAKTPSTRRALTQIRFGLQHMLRLKRLLHHRPRRGRDRGH